MNLSVLPQSAAFSYDGMGRSMMCILTPPQAKLLLSSDMDRKRSGAAYKGVYSKNWVFDPVLDL